MLACAACGWSASVLHLLGRRGLHQPWLRRTLELAKTRAGEHGTPPWLFQAISISPSPSCKALQTDLKHRIDARPRPPNGLHFSPLDYFRPRSPQHRLLTGLASLLTLRTAVWSIHESDVGVVDWHKCLVGVPPSGISTSAPLFFRAGNKGVIVTATVGDVLAALEPADGVLRT